MEYQGPTQSDLANVKALNRAFLVAISGADAAVFAAFAEQRLHPLRLARLASAPFLLFSFREQDNDYWMRMLEENPQIDLIDSAELPDAPIRQVQIAGLAFLWQLARRNPYAARIVTGASVNWCERLAGLTLVSVLARIAPRGDLLGARFADDDPVWRRLLGNGSSSKRHLRQSSQQSALQALLTRGEKWHYNPVQAAACTIRAPAQQAVGRDTVSIGDSKV